MTQQTNKTFNQFDEEASKLLEGTTDIEQLINEKTTLDEVLGQIPRLRPVQFTDVSQEKKESLNDIRKKYEGTPTTTREVHHEGLVQKLANIAKGKLIGKTEQEVIPSNPGILAYSEELITQGREQIQHMKKEINAVQMSMRAERGFIQKLHEELDKGNSLYDKFKTYLISAERIRGEGVELLIEGDISTEQRIRTQTIIEALDRRIHRATMDYNKLGCRIRDYHSQHDYLTKQIRSTDTQISTMEIRVSNLETLISGAALNVRGQQSRMKLFGVVEQLRTTADSMTQYINDIHQLNKDLANSNNNEPIPLFQVSYSEEQQEQIGIIAEESQQMYKQRMREIHDSIRRTREGNKEYEESDY